jgi:hypothetical protein
MQRRPFLTTALPALMAAAALPRTAVAQSAATNRTRWQVRSSEGFDAIAFLGPLSGGELYLSYYAEDAAAFAPRLAEAVRSDIAKLWAEAGADGFGLLGPTLSVFFSNGGDDATIDTLLQALEAREERILPAYRASAYWDAKDWRWFTAAAPRLEAIITALRDAGFAQFRAERAGSRLEARIGEVQRALNGFDVIAWQEKLTGRRFDPGIEIVLLQFSKPHGIKVQGQTFLQAIDYDTATTVRIAAHEMLHPPVPMDGKAAKAALAVLARDPLIPRIVRDHDPRWGYTSLEGLLDEDLVQALDQLISEALGVARNPADRWRKSDDGMHVLAGALYGLLRQDRWIETGGSIEAWLADAVRRGRLARPALHAVAGRVLERPAGKFWPVASRPTSRASQPPL